MTTTTETTTTKALEAENAELRARLETAEAKAAVSGGDWCRQNRAERAEAALAQVTAERDRLRLAVIGALTDAGEYLPVDGDPCAPELVRSRIADLKARAEQATADVARLREALRAVLPYADSRISDIHADDRVGRYQTREEVEALKEKALAASDAAHAALAAAPPAPAKTSCADCGQQRPVPPETFVCRRCLGTTPALSAAEAQRDELVGAGDEATAMAEPFCACGRRISACDRSRRGCDDLARARGAR